MVQMGNNKQHNVKIQFIKTKLTTFITILNLVVPHTRMTSAEFTLKTSNREVGIPIVKLHIACKRVL